MSDFSDWERAVFEPEFAIEHSKKIYEDAISILQGIVTDHVDSGYCNAGKFVDDLRHQTKTVSGALETLRADIYWRDRESRNK